MNTIFIIDINDKALDVYARLTENQLLMREDPANAMFIAESALVVERALDAGYIPVSAVIDCKLMDANLEILERLGDIPVYTAENEVLEKITGYKLTRGLLCAMKRKDTVTPQELCRNARRIAVLEDVMNPTNVGAMFRSAAALGIDGVLLTSKCADPLYRRSVRVSMGNVFLIPWAYIDGNDVPKELRSLGFKSAALALTDKSLSIRDPRPAAEEKLAVILGSEGPGLSENTISGCDYALKIPMYRGADSLNVAAAAAIAFYQLAQQ